MRGRFGRVSLAVVAAVLAVSCSSGSGPRPGATPAQTCAVPGLTADPGCWHQVRPLGSGGFPPAPGSQDTPQWEPGRFPLTLTPHLAFGGELWMVARQHSYSSPDGLAWTQHDKTDWGDRIYQSVVYFKDRLWMYGGMDYQSRTFLHDIWSTADGMNWTQAGTAAWPARGSQTMLVFQDQLWLFGGANHARADRGTEGFLNDVWVSDDGVGWTQVSGAAPWTARDLPGVVVFNGDLYLVGGQGQADVWKSTDGSDWTELTVEAGWKPRRATAARCSPASSGCSGVGSISPPTPSTTSGTPPTASFGTAKQSTRHGARGHRW